MDDERNLGNTVGFGSVQRRQTSCSDEKPRLRSCREKAFMKQKHFFELLIHLEIP